MTDCPVEIKTTNRRVINQLETRKRLLDAAREAVVQYGYQSASIMDIVNLAGFTKGAFFSNFKNKESILLELMRIQKQEDIELLGSYIALADGDIVVALDQYISTLDQRRDCAILDIELQLYARSNPDFAHSYYKIQDENRSAMGNLLENIFAKKNKSIPMKPTELADLFLALVQGTALQNNLKAGFFVNKVLSSLIETSLEF